MVLFLWNIFQRILPRRCWKNPSIVSYCVNHPVKQTIYLLAVKSINSSHFKQAIFYSRKKNGRIRRQK